MEFFRRAVRGSEMGPGISGAIMTALVVGTVVFAFGAVIAVFTYFVGTMRGEIKFLERIHIQEIDRIDDILLDLDAKLNKKK